MRAETLGLCEELAAANQLAERAVEARLRESRTAFRSLASLPRGIERGAEDAERMVQVGCEMRRIQLLSSGFEAGEACLSVAGTEAFSHAMEDLSHEQTFNQVRQQM